MYYQIQYQYHPLLTNAEGYADPTAAAVLIDEARSEISRRRTAKIPKKMEMNRQPKYKRAWSRKSA